MQPKVPGCGFGALGGRKFQDSETLNRSDRHKPAKTTLNPTPFDLKSSTIAPHAKPLYASPPGSPTAIVGGCSGARHRISCCKLDMQYEGQTAYAGPVLHCAARATVDTMSIL